MFSVGLQRKLSCMFTCNFGIFYYFLAFFESNTTYGCLVMMLMLKVTGNSTVLGWRFSFGSLYQLVAMQNYFFEAFDSIHFLRYKMGHFALILEVCIAGEVFQ